MKTVKRISIALVALFGMAVAMLWNGTLPHSGDALISQADARVGRPATPRSVAGVARRTTRRAVAVGAATTGAAAAGTYYYGAPGCRQVVNSKGQTYYRCP